MVNGVHGIVEDTVISPATAEAETNPNALILELSASSVSAELQVYD
jgi:hypothetical protein